MQAGNELGAAVALQAAPGQVTALIGPNGAGKRSVFSAISGFYRPSAGSVTLGGTDITAAPAAQALVNRRAS